MKKALITGISGQDGAWLAQLLLEKDYKVYGGMRRTSSKNVWRLEFLGIDKQIEYVPMEMLEYENIKRVLQKTKPDVIYNLAAQSFVHVSFEQPIFTAEVTALGPLRILEAVRELGMHKDVKIYQANSSEMMGKAQEVPQTETTRFYPRSPYAYAKAFAHHACVNHRESYNMFVISGMLWNHESTIRSEEFVTRKITRAVSEFVVNGEKPLRLGNLSAKRDWGYAKEYMEAAFLMMNYDIPEDFVIATNTMHTVREFVEMAFGYCDIEIEWREGGSDEKGYHKKTGEVLVEVSPEFYRPAEVDLLIGNPAKAKKLLGWEPKTTLQQLVHMMVRQDLEWTRQKKGVLVHG